MNLPRDNAVAMSALLESNVSPETKQMLVIKYIIKDIEPQEVSESTNIEKLLELTKKLREFSLPNPVIRPAI